MQYNYNALTADHATLNEQQIQRNNELAHLGITSDGGDPIGTIWLSQPSTKTPLNQTDTMVRTDLPPVDGTPTIMDNLRNILPFLKRADVPQPADPNTTTNSNTTPVQPLGNNDGVGVAQSVTATLLNPSVPGFQSPATTVPAYNYATLQGSSSGSSNPFMFIILVIGAGVAFFVIKNKLSKGKHLTTESPKAQLEHMV